MEDTNNSRSGTNTLDLMIAGALVIAAVGVLALPFLHGGGSGSTISGATFLRDPADVCWGCAEDAPYSFLLWLELVVVAAALAAGLGLSFPGSGWKRILRTFLLIVATTALALGPLRCTDCRQDGPVGLIPVFAIVAVGTLVTAVAAWRDGSSRRFRVVRATWIGTAAVLLVIVPGTRRQMPFTYDRLTWGFFVAIVAVALALAGSIAAVGGSRRVDRHPALELDG